MLPKLSRGTLADQVTERLLDYIQAQNLKPGDLLPSETSLAGSFGVSRPVIREALKNLEGKGVLEIVNGKGAIVRPIDSDPLRMFFERAMQMERGTILELMEIRRGLETQAATLAAQRRNQHDIDALAQVVRAMRENIHDADAYTRLDVEFHVRLAAASHNTLLVYLVESIRDTLRNTISAGLQARGQALNLESIQLAHEALLQTLTAGDPAAAVRAMEHHFDEAIASMTNPQS